MSFRNAARVVVSRIFRLLRANGSTAMELREGEHTFAGITFEGAMLAMLHDKEFSQLFWTDTDLNKRIVIETPAPESIPIPNTTRSRLELVSIPTVTANYRLTAFEFDALAASIAGAYISAAQPQGGTSQIELNAFAANGDTSDIVVVPTQITLTSDGDIILDAGTGEVKDGAERQFLRTGTNRANEQLVQYDFVSTTTNGSGQVTVTFGEPFGTTPVVTATAHRNSSIPYLVMLQTRTASQATFVVFEGVEAGGLFQLRRRTNAPITIHYVAAGFKSM